MRIVRVVSSDEVRVLCIRIKNARPVVVSTMTGSGQFV